MIRHTRLLTLVLPVLALSACDDDGITDNGAPEPAALVRFINVVPDRGTVDLRFIDRVENLPTLQGVGFRSHSGMYQRVEPGARHARVFPNSSDPAVTQQFLIDETVNLTADTRYTLVYAGMATGDQDQLVVLEDDFTLPTPPAGSIAIQVLHGAVGVDNVDVYITPSAPDADNADPLGNAVAVVNNLAYLGTSAYVTVPVRPSSGESAYQFTVTPAGSTTPLFSVRIDHPGTPAPATGNYGAQPGFQISGSVMTAVVAAGAVPGSPGDDEDNLTPTVFTAVDKTLDP